MSMDLYSQIFECIPKENLQKKCPYNFVESVRVGAYNRPTNVYEFWHSVAVTFNLQTHKVFVNICLFLVTLTCFDTHVSCAKITAKFMSTIIHVSVTH
jgi:hypothetical protein